VRNFYKNNEVIRKMPVKMSILNYKFSSLKTTENNFGWPYPKIIILYLQITLIILLDKNKYFCPSHIFTYYWISKCCNIDFFYCFENQRILQ